MLVTNAYLTAEPEERFARLTAIHHRCLIMICAMRALPRGR